MSESDLPHVPGGRKRTGMHRRGDDGVRRPSGYVLSNKRNTGRRKGKPWKKKKLGALRKN